MFIARTPENGSCYFVTSNGYRYIESPDDLALIKAALEGAGLDSKVRDIPYPRFIKLVTFIHAAFTASDADVRHIEASIKTALDQAVRG